MNHPNEFSQTAVLSVIKTPFSFSLAAEMKDLDEYEELLPGKCYIGTHAYYNERTECLSIRLFGSSDYVILHHSYITINPCITVN